MSYVLLYHSLQEWAAKRQPGLTFAHLQELAAVPALALEGTKGVPRNGGRK